MAVDTFGAEAKPDGLADGQIMSSSKSKPPAARRQPPRSGIVKSVTGLATRLLVWYTIATIIFRCPKNISDLSEDSPRLCKPYLQLHSFVTPYVQPYYNTHVEPHIAKVQPYVDYANHRFVQPATTFAQDNYVKYGAPQVDRMQKLGQEQWDKIIVPQLTSARQVAQKQYDATLAPHVQKVNGYVRPYYNSATVSAQNFWEMELQPAYNLASPYVHKGYSEAEKFVLQVFIPYTQWVNGVVWASMHRHVFPALQVLYGENVEPQIMRIKQRLGRYRDEKKVEAAANAVELSPSSSSSVASSSAQTAYSTTTASTISEVSTAAATVLPSTEETPSPVVEKSAGELFSEDLDLWERQVHRAVEQGVDHLKERIFDICHDQTTNQVRKVGDALLVQLEETENTAVTNLKTTIQTTVSHLPDEVTEDDVTVASKDFETKVRSAGQQVREKAQQIRAWRRNFDVETTDLVEAAANSTLETVDNIRELRLQEIGRRWASHDGIPHRDWSRYNLLKRTSGQWRDSIIETVTKDESLSKAIASAAEVEERAMAVVEDAAKELARLKGVALWKLRARDDTDDFESKIVPPIIAKAKQQVSQALSGLSDAVVGTSSQGTVESVTSKVSSLASAAAGIVSDSAASLSQAMSASVDPVVSAASSASKSIVDSSVLSASSAASAMSEKYFGSSSNAAEDIPSQASSSFESATRSLDSGYGSIIRETASSMSSAGAQMLSAVSEELAGLPSKASASAESRASAVSDSIIALGASESTTAVTEVTHQIVSSGSSLASEVTEAVEKATESAQDIPSIAQSATSRVFAGAMAQAVPEQKPVFDEPLDDDEETDSFLDTALASGREQMGFLTKAVEEAIYGKSATGARASATQIASEIYQSAMDAASQVFYGPKPTGNQAVKFASEKYDEAMNAASRVVYGTPTPVVQAVASSAASHLNELSSQASSRFNDALAYAASQSALAKSRVSEQISGTPKPIHEQMLASVESAYADASSRAALKFQSVVQHTTVLSLPSQLAYESVSSAASSRLSVALSAASAQYSQAKIAVGIEPTPVPQSILNEAQRRYYEGIGYAHDQYSSYVSSASKAIRSAGLPVAPSTTPAYQALLGSAQSQYALASAAASSALAQALASASSVAGVKETTPAQSVLNAASDQYSSAVARASSALYGTQTPAYEAMMSAASSRYQEILSGASETYDSITSAAKSAGGAQATEESVLQSAAGAAASQYSAAVLAAQSAYSQVSADASQAIYGTSTNMVASASSAFSAYVYGTEPAWTDEVAAQAAKNWEAIVAAASDRIYGQPTPFYANVAGQASDAAAQVTSVASNAAAQVTSAADVQYSAISSLFSSLVSGREEDFTARVFSQLSSAYYTGAPAAASSASSAAVSVYSDASSVITSVFTPPAAIDDILASVSANLDAAVSAASQQVYGTEAGTIEKATSAAASAASNAAAAASSAASQASSKASEAVYGTPAPYLQQIQSNLALSANDAITKVYAVLFDPTPEPVASQVVSGASGAYESAASIVGDTYAAASSVADGAASRVSEMVFGPERTTALESARKRIEEAIESARIQIEGFAGDAGNAIAQGTSAVKDTAASAASGASSVAESVVQRVKDEL